jgi:hypothetical protein
MTAFHSAYEGRLEKKYHSVVLILYCHSYGKWYGYEFLFTENALKLVKLNVIIRVVVEFSVS